VGPVSLSLLAGKSREAEEGLTAGWADFCHYAAQLSDTSLITPEANHFEQSRRARTGMLPQRVSQKIKIGCGKASTGALRGTRAAVRFERAPERVRVNPNSAAMVPIFQCSA
jgi:hypothetical protein